MLILWATGTCSCLFGDPTGVEIAMCWFSLSLKHNMAELIGTSANPRSRAAASFLLDQDPFQVDVLGARKLLRWEIRFELGSAPYMQAWVATTLALPLPCIAFPKSLWRCSQCPTGAHTERESCCSAKSWGCGRQGPVLQRNSGAGLFSSFQGT